MESAASPQRGAVKPHWQTAAVVAVGILAVIVVRNVFVAAHQVLGWTVAAALVAVLLHPVISLLDRRLPRPAAFLVAFVFLALLAIGFTLLYTVGVLDEVDRLQDQAPELAQTIENRMDRIGDIATDIGLTDQVTTLTDRLDEQTGSGGDAVRSAALSAPPFFVTGILTVFLLVYGKQMVDGGVDQLSDRLRRPLTEALPGATRRFQIYVGGSLAQAVVNGLAVFAAAVLLDLPAAPLLALAAVLVSLVPYLGILLGWIPVVVLGLGTSTLVAVLAVAALAVGLQIAEAAWWRRLVDSRSVHVGPAVMVIVAVLGFSLYSIGGALGACGLAVFVLALLDELSDVDEPLPTALDDTFDH